ncbi:MAG: hypothetical protein FJW85_10175 [Actinobacteria bacterium]|nr:hypothetical protein [Actinomycetota bacterium]
MKMRYPLVASLVACIAISMTSSATAEEATTTLITETIWVGESGVKSGTTLTVGVREFVQPSLFCSGDGCVGSRPARVQIQKTIKKRLRWVTFASGTLDSLKIYNQPAPALDTRRPAVFTLRTVLPADDTFAQVVSPVVTVKVLPATKVTVAPGGLLTKSPGSGAWEITPGEGTISITTRPAAAGRQFIVRWFSPEGEPIVTRAKTDSRGRATITMTAQADILYAVELLPTRQRAGWSVYAWGTPAVSAEAFLR